LTRRSRGQVRKYWFFICRQQINKYVDEYIRTYTNAYKCMGWIFWWFSFLYLKRTAQCSPGSISFFRGCSFLFRSAAK
jgi:hypothetical protein